VDSQFWFIQPHVITRNFLTFANTTAIAYGRKVARSLKIFAVCNSGRVCKRQKITSRVATDCRDLKMGRFSVVESRSALYHANAPGTALRNARIVRLADGPTCYTSIVVGWFLRKQISMCLSSENLEGREMRDINELGRLMVSLFAIFEMLWWLGANKARHIGLAWRPLLCCLGEVGSIILFNKLRSRYTGAALSPRLQPSFIRYE